MVLGLVALVALIAVRGLLYRGDVAPGVEIGRDHLRLLPVDRDVDGLAEARAELGLQALLGRVGGEAADRDAAHLDARRDVAAVQQAADGEQGA
ncbi:MAG: hypothetical protein ACKOSO_02200, partial [Actinomycetota bacterium]